MSGCPAHMHESAYLIIADRDRVWHKIADQHNGLVPSSLRCFHILLCLHNSCFEPFALLLKLCCFLFSLSNIRINRKLVECVCVYESDIHTGEMVSMRTTKPPPCASHQSLC